VRFPEPWSSTSLAKQAVLGTAQDIFVLDSAFALIEGHPPLLEWGFERLKTEKQEAKPEFVCTIEIRCLRSSLLPP